jgi:Ca-activated chloride channel family protein
MKIETILDHQTILENRRSTVFFAVRLAADRLGTESAPPAAYCIVLDHSSSIDERVFALARRFAQELVRHLPEAAQFALVALDDSASALVDIAPVADKPALQAMIATIQQSDFGSNLSAGWLLAREQLRNAPPGLPRKILILTDGEHTAGVRDENLLMALAKQCTTEGIAVSTVNLSGANCGLLAEIAELGGGAYHAALTGENVLQIVAAEIGGLAPVAAQNVRVRIKGLDFCEGIEPLGFEIRESSAGWLTFAVGDLLSAEERTLCFNLTVPILPCIEDQPCASLASEALLDLEIGYEAVTPTGIFSKSFADTIRVPPLSKTTYPPPEDGSLRLRDGP